MLYLNSMHENSSIVVKFDYTYHKPIIKWNHCNYAFFIISVFAPLFRWFIEHVNNNKIVN